MSADERGASRGSASETRDERFPKSHRLKRRRLIRALFDRSRTDTGTVAAGCVRLVFRVASPEEVGTEGVPVQIGFAPGSCPTAVARNRVRRLLRESYRRHQHALTDHFEERPGEVLTVMALFRGHPEAPEPIHRDLPRALEQAVRQFREA
jgi:ribonuclease P protein component